MEAMQIDASKSAGKRIADAPPEGERDPKTVRPSNALVPVGSGSAATQVAANTATKDLLQWPIERLATQVNQVFLDTIIQNGEGGYEVPDDQIVPTLRVYEIHVTNLRNAFRSVLYTVLRTKFIERGDRTVNAATTLATNVSNLTADACMAALFAKLRTLHRQIYTYKGRFTDQPTYTKDIELPLPFAVAIDGIGMFRTSAMSTRFNVVPVYPEGTKNEGRSADSINFLEYKSYLAYFAEIGIPTRTIDTRVTPGNAWWTYRTSYDGDVYDLKINYPPLHFNDHLANLAIMFLGNSGANRNNSSIIITKDDDLDYGWHVKDIREGEQARAFAALSQWAPRYWNEKNNV
nr:hypothetical protein [Raphanus sativus cryptic virus 2]